MWFIHSLTSISKVMCVGARCGCKLLNRDGAEAYVEVEVRAKVDLGFALNLGVSPRLALYEGISLASRDGAGSVGERGVPQLSTLNCQTHLRQARGGVHELDGAAAHTQ